MLLTDDIARLLSLRGIEKAVRLTPLCPLLLIAVALATLSCSQPSLQEERQFIALGTVISVSIHQPPAEMDELLDAHFVPALYALEHQWRSFGDGELGRANDLLEKDQCANVSVATKALIERAFLYRHQSGGLFDPALGLVIDEWGFRDHHQTPSVPSNVRPGAAAVINWMFKSGQWHMCSNQPTRIDLGAIAKGQIVWQLGEILKQHGMHNAIINAGGDVLVLGTRGAKPWRIAVQHPRAATLIARIEAQPGEAFFSSGDYYRFRQIDGERIHHIVDPSTASPAKGSIAVTVINSDPVLADVAATALFVAGPLRFRQTARALGVSQAMLIDHELNVHTLEGWKTPLPNKLP